MRFAYLAGIAASFAGVLALDGGSGPACGSRRLARAIGVTVPVFLAFDAAGAARGWFSSNPERNSLIVPPGIPLEEPQLLSFLTLVSVAVHRVPRRRLGERVPGGRRRHPGGRYRRRRSGTDAPAAVHLGRRGGVRGTHCRCRQPSDLGRRVWLP
jgi:hypothetical protein